jgi:predicted amidohydrolase
MRIAAAAYPLDFLPDWDAYAAKISAWVADAAAKGADLLVFPEYGAMELASLGGAQVAGDLQAALREVMRHAKQAHILHAGLAAEYGVHILAASGPAPGRDRPVNRATLYGPRGLIGHQDKQIMTRFEAEDWHIAPGSGLTLFDTPLGRLGVLICYDSEFPLLARALVDAGAEILLVPSCTEALSGFTRVRVGAMARALENQCVTVQAPLVGRADWCPAVDVNTGRAAIYGPPDLGFPPDGVIAEGGMNTPGWVIADIDRTAIARVRLDGSVLNHRDWAAQENRLTAPVRVLKAQENP